ncbi:hypothetical protein HPP92_000868 [Vanilla planifolia]|uniref:BHLH domain-containing protein n=1 Tax=Vanilla planifolia TaxID=51239 RepID=A0A835VEU4_VANPL|nr:hypothetical protein HPP92_000868 [Vanilla planifolia]
MESSFRTRFLVSPSLSAPISFTDGLPFYGLDCGSFASFPPLLPDQIGACSSNFSATGLSFHNFMKLEQAELVEEALIPAATSFKIDSAGFLQLPDLLSLDLFRDPFAEGFVPCETRRHSVSVVQSAGKRPRSFPQCSRPLILHPPFSPKLMEAGPSSNARRNTSSLSTERSRRRRQMISERTRILEKLMPWERRLDTGTMLEEACKYVKFLEAQVTALETMPSVSVFSAMHLPPGNSALGLERLTRPQLLQVMVNSSSVQDVLYKKGYCVVSAEQMAILSQAMERRPQPQALRLLGHKGGAF